MPSSIKMEGTHSLNVVHNGAEVFGQLEPRFRDLLTEHLTTELQRFVENRLPDLA